MEISVLISEGELEERIKALGEEIKKDYEGEEITLLCVLKGSVIFTADLARHLDPTTCEFEFIEVSSYGDGNVSSGEIKITKDLTCIKDRHVLIIEDIVDTGHTLAFLVEYLKTKYPKSLKICSLLDKPERREAKGLNIDYLGFTIPNKFVVGFGLDVAQKYRNLGYIGFVNEGGK